MDGNLIISVGYSTLTTLLCKKHIPLGYCWTATLFYSQVNYGDAHDAPSRGATR